MLPTGTCIVCKSLATILPLKKKKESFLTIHILQLCIGEILQTFGYRCYSLGIYLAWTWISLALILGR